MKNSSLISARNENPIDAGAKGEAFKITNKTGGTVLCHGFFLKYNAADKKALLDIEAGFLGGQFDPIIDGAEFSTFGPSRDADRGANLFLFRGGALRWTQGSEWGIFVNPPALIAAGNVEISFLITEV